MLVTLPTNMQKKWSKIVFLSLFVLFQGFLYAFLFSNDKVIDFVINHLTFPLSNFISKISGSVQFPIGELFYLGLLFLFIWLIFNLLKSFLKNRTKVNNYIVKLLIVINCCYFVYTFAWGIMYKKESLTFDKKEINIDPMILKSIYCNEMDKAIFYRNKISPSEARPVQFKTSLVDYNKDFKELQYDLKEIAWLKNYRFLEKPQYKLSTISMIQNYIGILGYYNPFTVESNLNKYNSPLKQSSTMFHEYGHQMGFASESEANFLSYYLGTQSKNPEVNYSVYYKSIFSLLGAISKTDSYFVKMELDNLDTKIKVDRKAEIEYYKKYEGKTSEAFSEVNNQFLKANDQEGTISYNKYVEYIYYLYQQKNGTSK